jgi:uncharacterized protein
VSQSALARSLDAVIEDCVNAIGVDVNTASPALLTRISGLNQTLASNIVEFRNQNGAFASRDQLKKVPRLGDKTFEQAAGFLRVMNGDNPLDASAVHPESYSIVEKIAQKSTRQVRGLIGDSAFLRSLKPVDYIDENFGLPTVTDIIKELDKPGRDPRPEFKSATFMDGVEDIKHLVPGMILEGTVTNVAAFGAFVDVGVHQDGLVHISALAQKFVKDPRDVVKTGDIVKVKVMEVDVARKRIGLSMRMDDVPGEKRGNESRGPSVEKHNRNEARRGEPQRGSSRNDGARSPAVGGTFAQLFADAGKKKNNRL